VVAVTTETAEALRRIHDPSPQVAAALGRLSTGALLLASSLEKVTALEPMLTIEVDGGGPAGRLLATASPAGWVRAIVANPLATAESRTEGKLNVAGVVGCDGELIVTRDSGVGEPYRGVVELVSGELARDLALYLSESEQSPAAVVLGVRTLREGRIGGSAGLLVQLFPGVSDQEALALTEHVRELGAVSARLSQGEGPREWLARVFPGGCTILNETPVSFRCGCSIDRVEAALKLLGTNEILAISEEDSEDGATVVCGFCKGKYLVVPERLQELVGEAEQENSELGIRN
jgi:molecular chaperone Hsp33